jgi:uncharacterized protein
MGTLNKGLCFIGFTALITASVSSQTLSSLPVPENASGQMAALSKKALAGDTKAQLRMGLAYEFGQDAEKNLANAMRWYHVAADRGDPVAQTDLGYLYETGANGPANPEEAAKWYTRAAVSGFTRAKFNLGVLYFEGKGVQRSDEEAVHWIGEAAHDGCPSAVLVLSYMYESGRGVPRDPHKAAELRRKAAKKNDSELCMSLVPKRVPVAASAVSFAPIELPHLAP